MCGIYGTNKNYTTEQLNHKLERISFRGPDYTEVASFGKDNNITLGHNRLSIIDLDPRSNQPFTYNFNIHIVFNGEIYNFLKLKNQLKAKGYLFNTTSDTEVICAAYLEYGYDCLSQFNGMFAFVIYDETKNILFGARDRMGQKPFYYSYKDKQFEFSSQISSIQLHNNSLSISKKAIDYYLVWSFIPDPYTIFNEIEKLHAGHYLVINLNTNTLITEQYWDIPLTENNPYVGSYDEAKTELKHLLKDAVSSRLVADVPIGVFLSGGVDSSLIASIASETSPKKVKTFSVKFNEKGFDESLYAKKVANHLKTDHHVIECNYNEGIDLVQNFSHYYDEPFADASAIPSMLLAKYTSKHVTVAVSGDGGDESFIGYHRYKWMKQVELMYKSPKAFRHLTSKVLLKLPYYKLKMIGKGLEYQTMNDLYLASITDLDFSWLNNKIENHAYLSELKYLENSKKSSIIERISDFDLKAYLNWDINVKVDRATMAYSLEGRAPLLDHRIVEFSRMLPTKFKYDGNNMKRVLKDVLYDYVPQEYFNRPKAGFTMPFSDWFRKELKDMVLSELNSEGLNQIPNINTDEVKLRINQHMEGTWNRYPLIWKLLVLKQWLNNNGKGYSIV